MSLISGFRKTTIDEVIEQLGAGQSVTISVPVNQNGWASARVSHNQELETCDQSPDLCGGTQSCLPAIT